MTTQRDRMTRRGHARAAPAEPWRARDEDPPGSAADAQRAARRSHEWHYSSSPEAAALGDPSAQGLVLRWRSAGRRSPRRVNPRHAMPLADRR